MTETVFKKVAYQLNKLVEDIELGEIGLPDIQRPFVWEATKVRDLFDSMYRGYPVGHLLLWESGAEPGARQIGIGSKQVVPNLLIVDGQQRLTSLFAVNEAAASRREGLRGKADSDCISASRRDVRRRRRPDRKGPGVPSGHRRHLGLPDVSGHHRVLGTVE